MAHHLRQGRQRAGSPPPPPPRARTTRTEDDPFIDVTAAIARHALRRARGARGAQRQHLENAYLPFAHARNAAFSTDPEGGTLAAHCALTRSIAQLRQRKPVPRRMRREHAILHAFPSRAVGKPVRARPWPAPELPAERRPDDAPHVAHPVARRPAPRASSAAARASAARWA